MSGNVKKILIVLVLLAVAGGVYFTVGRSADPLKGNVVFVCVATGERVSFSRKSPPNVIPVVNPSTGEATLLPCHEEDGRLYVGSRYRDELREGPLAEANKYVDPNTLEVLDAPRK